MRKLFVAMGMLLLIGLVSANGCFKHSIDGNLADWGLDLSKDWSLNSTWLPNAGVQFIVEDNYNPNYASGVNLPGVHILGVGSSYAFYDEPKVMHKDGYLVPEPYGGELYDMEAFYFDQDDNCIYIAIVTSEAPDAKGDAAPGDLALNLDDNIGTGDYGYEYGVKLESYHAPLTLFGLYSMPDWQEPPYIPGNKPSYFTSGTYEGQVNGVYVDSGIQDRGEANYVIELAIPKSDVGEPSQVTMNNLYFSEYCGNEHIAAEIMSFCTDADSDIYYAYDPINCPNGNDCNDNNASIHPGATELCNGVDDNCNRAIDEGFNLSQSCTVGVGECQRTGVFVCKADGSGTHCNVVSGEPGTEICNDQKDNDCDGYVDCTDSDCSADPECITICGDGTLEQGEQCEKTNGSWGGCCNTATCQFKTGDTICRASGGVCDLEEKCTGSTATCPSDVKSTALCRGAVGQCDVAEYCDGVNNDCPVDAKASQNITCNNDIYCDGSDHCDGNGDCVNLGPAVDCGSCSLPEIAQCSYNPDELNQTFDYAPSFTSTCDEQDDMCTQASYEINHVCADADQSDEGPQIQEQVRTCEATCDGYGTECTPYINEDFCYYSGACNTEPSSCTCVYDNEYCPESGTVTNQTCYYGTRNCTADGCTLLKKDMNGYNICNPERGPINVTEPINPFPPTSGNPSYGSVTLGCKYNDPQCREGYECVDNACVPLPKPPEEQKPPKEQQPPVENATPVKICPTDEIIDIIAPEFAFVGDVINVTLLIENTVHPVSNATVEITTPLEKFNLTTNIDGNVNYMPDKVGLYTYRVPDCFAEPRTTNVSEKIIEKPNQNATTETPPTIAQALSAYAPLFLSLFVLFALSIFALKRRKKSEKNEK